MHRRINRQQFLTPERRSTCYVQKQEVTSLESPHLGPLGATREPDLQKIAGTVIALAMAQAEKEAQADAERRSEQEPPHAS